MQAIPKIKNKNLLHSLLLKVRVGTVVNAGGNYYYNTSGINSAVTDANNWFKIFGATSGAITPVDKVAGDITGTDPDFSIDLSSTAVPDFPVIFKVYVDINGDDNYLPVEPVVYNPVSKLLSGLSSPVDFPDQKIKIFFQ
jgi:hypothetical protein